MSFQEGNNLATKRKVRRGGPKSKHEIDAIAAARVAFEKVIAGKAESIAAHYSRRVFKNDAVLLDARKKLWPDDLDGTAQGGDTFIQFNFGSVAAPKPIIEVGLHNGNGRSFDGGALHIGGDESGSE